MARPGEFSERAFLNNKIDLAQAEAIADLIESSTEQAARSAQRSLQGDFSKKINQLLESLITLRLYIEASIDFVEEEIDFIHQGKIIEKLKAILTQLETIQATAKQGCLLRDGIHIVIAGKPNAGKSSLLNKLSGKETAIVTDIAGTTRDVLREHIQIDGMPVHVIDTAGIHESDNPIEQEGIRRAHEAMNHADHILLMIDDRHLDEKLSLSEDLPVNIPITRIHNKIDLTGKEPGIHSNGKEIYLSVRTGEGLNLLRQHLKKCAGYENETDNAFIARRRHLEALSKAQTSIQNALQQKNSTELMAEELKLAQKALAEITGEFSTNDLLDRIFSSFCIGK